MEFSKGAVPFGGVGDLIALAGFQNELAAVFKLGVQLALETEENMPLLTPMIGKITPDDGYCWRRLSQKAAG
jgi:hypothetical protein